MWNFDGHTLHTNYTNYKNYLTNTLLNPGNIKI